MYCAATEMDEAPPPMTAFTRASCVSSRAALTAPGLSKEDTPFQKGAMVPFHSPRSPCCSMTRRAVATPCWPPLRKESAELWNPRRSSMAVAGPAPFGPSHRISAAVCSGACWSGTVGHSFGPAKPSSSAIPAPYNRDVGELKELLVACLHDHRDAINS